MPTQSYLTLSLFDSKYGLASATVREIFPLPELRSIPDMPGDIVGVLDLRGDIVPIVHLAKRLGLPPGHCQLSDSVVVIEWEGVTAGILVHDTHEVVTLDQSAIEPEPDYGRIERINTAFVAGLATINEELVSLIAIDRLIRDPEQVAQLIDNEHQATVVGEVPATEPKAIATLGDFYELHCPDISPADRAIFQLRAQTLRQDLADTISDTFDRLPLAIVGLNDEFFGIELSSVKEFITVTSTTFIPCCPSHILGCTNLRGEVLVLVDIRSALNLSGEGATDFAPPFEAIVIEVGELVVGVPVDRIVDVAYVPPSDITSVPSNLSANAQRYFKGTLAFEEGMLSILDAEQLLNSRQFVVDEVA